MPIFYVEFVQQVQLQLMMGTASSLVWVLEDLLISGHLGTLVCSEVKRLFLRDIYELYSVSGITLGAISILVKLCTWFPLQILLGWQISVGGQGVNTSIVSAQTYA